MNLGIREAYDGTGVSWINLIPPLRARKHFFPEALQAYERSIAEFVDAAMLDPSPQTIRLACDVVARVADLDTEAVFQSDDTVRVLLEAAATRMRSLLSKVIPSAEPSEQEP